MFVVAGATGHVGKVVAETLLAEGKSVRLIARDPGKVAALVDRGAEAVAASLDDADQLAQAFKGARGAFVLIPPPGMQATDILASRRKIADALGRALVESSVRHVVLLSSIGAQHADGTGIVRTVHHAEQVLHKLPQAATFIRAGFFMENLYGSLEPVLKNETYYSLSTPATKLPWVATHDLGLAAAHALLDAHEGKNIIDVKGPEDYSSNDIAAILGRILGKKITVAPVPPEAHVNAMTSMGMGKEMAEMYAGLYAGVVTGKIAWETDTAKHVRGKIGLEHFLRGALPAAKK